MRNSALTARRRAALGSAVFMLIAPGTMAGVLPWLLTHWQHRPVPGGALTRVVGATMVAAGAAVLTHSSVRFVREGIGTPVPIAPPRYLVIGGIYRHVRNPMYIGLASTIIGQALLLGQPKLLVLVLVGSVPVATFVRLYEEPALAKTYGAQYEQYRRNVPGWLPRLRPWNGGS